MKNPLTHILRSLESKLLKFGLKATLALDQPKDQKEITVAESDGYSSMVFISVRNKFPDVLELHYYGEVKVYDLSKLMEIRIFGRRVYIDGYNVRLRHRYYFKTQEHADALYESLSKRLEDYKNPPALDVDKLVNTLVELDDLLGGIPLNFPTK